MKLTYPDAEVLTYQYGSGGLVKSLMQVQRVTLHMTTSRGLNTTNLSRGHLLYMETTQEPHTPIMHKTEGYQT